LKNQLNCPYVVNHRLKYKFENVNVLDQTQGFNQNIRIDEALNMANIAGLDLVCFSEAKRNKSALCKILDYGKWKYQAEKKRKKEKKQHKKTTKEIRVSPLIADHDLKHKIKKVNEIINENNDVLLTMKLAGRQMQYKKEAIEKMNEITKLCDFAKEVSRKTGGSFISIRITKQKEEV